MYRYHAFGITLSTEIDLPFFNEVTGNESDVEIRFGDVPGRLVDPVHEGLIFESGEKEFLMSIPGMARFHIINGEKIVISPEKGVGKDTIQSFLIGTVFSALFQQRGMLPVHGSCVNSGSGNIIIAGNSGSGKSTLAAYFYVKGHQVLSDDLCIIGLDHENELVLYPGYKAIKLWEDVVNKLKINGPLRRVRKDLKKFFYQVEMPLYQEPLKISGMYVLWPGHLKENELVHINGMNKFLMLKNNTYGVPFIKKTEYEKLHFNMCSTMARNIGLHGLRRFRGEFNPGALYELIRKNERP